MRKETIKVYKFEELEPCVQSDVINKNRGCNTDFDEWYYGVEESYHEKLKEFGLEFKGLCFDLYHNYASFDEVRIKNLNLFLKKYLKWLGLTGNDYLNFCYKLKKVLLNGEVSISIENPNRGEGFNYIHISEGNSNLTEKYNYLNKVDDFIKELNHNLLNDLNNTYNYLQSDEAIRETIVLNEYEFIENGSRW